MLLPGVLVGLEQAVTLNLLFAPRFLPLWRPWLSRAEEGTGQRREQTDTARPRQAMADGGPDKALAFFHHPVRLLWPKSKSFDYLYGVGEKLLETFPVQATICFYEESGSEEEEEEEEEEEGEDAGDTVAVWEPQKPQENPETPGNLM
ncbi:ripply transcriptional repressor 1 [Columba livia]|uniref:Ripply transcriptional repressor 1 n=1 Tax=Columba livia TaxID=8932 RepID=A0A2I0M4G4_COLLI|nr:ripply transcriptional repressor 1 [Columba livia]